MNTRILMIVIIIVFFTGILFPSDVLIRCVSTEDGQTITFAYRIPDSIKSPAPTIIFIHGGASLVGKELISSWLESQRTELAFFKRGFICVEADFRTYKDDMQSPGPILDCKAIVEDVRKFPLVDSDRIVLYGGSGGSSIVLDLLSSSVAAAAAVVGEPASMIYCGVLGKKSKAKSLYADPLVTYTPKKKAATREKMARISTPLMILHSNVAEILKYNNLILMTELEAVGIPYEFWFFPGLKHGFYWGNEEFIDEPTFDLMISAVNDFISRSLLKAKREKE